MESFHTCGFYFPKAPKLIHLDEVVGIRLEKPAFSGKNYTNSGMVAKLFIVIGFKKSNLRVSPDISLRLMRLCQTKSYQKELEKN